MSSRLLCAFIIVSVFVSNLASARPSKDRLYGWELEFTNSKVANSEFGIRNAQANSVNDAARERWYEIIYKICEQRRDCRIKEIEDWTSWRKSDGEVVWSWEIVSYRVIYNDGFWFQLSLDPGVVEVQMKPSNAARFRALAPRLQRDIFDTAAKAGLRPKKRSETHLHTGAEAAFGMNLRLIRNYLVDGVNHPEWTFLFANGLHNAPPLILLPPGKYAAFKAIIDAVDRGEITDVETFIKAIRRRVYDVTYDQSIIRGGFDLAQKFQQWNVERMRRRYKNKEKTLENRSMPAPQDAEDVADLTELVDARIDHLLKTPNKPVLLRPYQEKLTPREQVTRFKEYVTESGLSMKVYLRFMRKSCQRLLTRDAG